MTIVLVTTAIGFGVSLLNFPQTGFNIGLCWGAYNLLTIAVAMMTLLDLPKLSFFEWYSHKKEINLYGDRRVYQGQTQKISEEGVEVKLDPQVSLPTEVMVELIPEVLILSGKVTRSYRQEDELAAIVKFQNVSIEQQRELVEMLYCRPGQWERRDTPNELQSVLILFKLLLRPLILFNRQKIKQMRLQY